jgi:predicted GNAT superfamily acetyltransferase
MENVTLGDGTVIRALASQREFAAAVRVQDETWGAEFSERVPAAILMVGQKIGGVSAGAFSPEGRLLGFVFGLTGVRDGRLVHWSDMLAVRSEARGRHLGEALKRFQRDRCAELGIKVIYWTYDPLVSCNAHLNLNRLGARVEEFVPDMYGADTHSRVHALGTDRFVVAWLVGAEPNSSQPTAGPAAGGPVMGSASSDPPALDAPLPDAPVVAVRIPPDYHALIDADFDKASKWRSSARRAFLHYLPLGYRVSAFVSGADAAYLLTRDT